MIDSAEAHGGQAFRTSHPNAEIQAFLCPSMLEQFGVGLKKPIGPQGHGPLRPWAFSTTLRYFPSTISQGNPVWNVMYSDEETSEMFIVVLDPITARFIASWPPAPTSARANLEIANARATAWAPDAQLVSVFGNQVTAPEGLNTFWSYIYRSATLDSCWLITAGGGPQGMVTFEGGFPFPLPSNQPLPSQWIDTPEVIALCEANGGTTYRSANPTTEIQVQLGYGLYPQNPQIPVWWVQYTSYIEGDSPSPPPLEFFIQAETGQLLTDVENPEPYQKSPVTYALGQNYPNPFNSITIIPYAVKTSGRVKITVHDLEGRLVETLVDGFHAPGMYQVKVDGKDWASGVYFYRIQVNGFEAVRKMLLMR